MHKLLKNKSLVEVLSIGGIIAVLFWVDRAFLLTEWVSGELLTRYPGMREYNATLIGVAFVGLGVFSITQRVRGNQEHKARLQLEKYLRQRDFVDPVTGLANRQGLKLMLGQLRKSETRTKISILTFEIRNLDSIKSVHGEQTAEFVEASFTELLKLLSSSTDFIAVAERGQFYVLVSSDDENECRFQIDRVIDTVMVMAKKGIETDNHTLSTFISFGLVDIAAQDKAEIWDSEQCVQRADYALQIARTKGHESIETYNADMEASIQMRALIEGELLGALTAEQIRPHFQPFIDMNTNSVVGVEILARWDHPEYGNIPPNVFIPVAEDVGAMRALTLSMLKQACEAAKTWPANIKLSFNISPNELRDAATINGFFDILKITGVESERVEIEITENAFVEEGGDITEAVAMLKKRGVKISIDDFGTGFSNLKHLKILPFDKIKIDQTFVRDMEDNPESQAIVRNVIALGRSLGLPTIAEGVELGKNREILQELGCTIGQGYLFAEALKATDVLPFIHRFENEAHAMEQVA